MKLYKSKHLLTVEQIIGGYSGLQYLPPYRTTLQPDEIIVNVLRNNNIKIYHINNILQVFKKCVAK